MRAGDTGAYSQGVAVAAPAEAVVVSTSFAGCDSRRSSVSDSQHSLYLALDNTPREE